MRLPITKYHGLGNDFVIVDYEDVKTFNLSDLAIKLCDRHQSVGGDGLIAVKTNPLEMIYYNSDGSRAKMCGNGIRCFAQFAYDSNIITNNIFSVKTLAGELTLSIENIHPFMVQVDMGKASFLTKDIPMDIDRETFINQSLIIDEKEKVLTSLSMNVTHTVLETNQFDDKEMEITGKLIQNHPYFPKSTNVNFYQKINDNQIKMQTYERGAGLTLACGTGACAVYAALHENNQISGEVEMKLPLGSLYISIDESGHIIMTGPSKKIISGEIEFTLDHRGENNV
jgi:diaminopimelate epimerase